MAQLISPFSYVLGVSHFFFFVFVKVPTLQLLQNCVHLPYKSVHSLRAAPALAFAKQVQAVGKHLHH